MGVDLGMFKAALTRLDQQAASSSSVPFVTLNNFLNQSWPKLMASPVMSQALLNNGPSPDDPYDGSGSLNGMARQAPQLAPMNSSTFGSPAPLPPSTYARASPAPVTYAQPPPQQHNYYQQQQQQPIYQQQHQQQPVFAGQGQALPAIGGGAAGAAELAIQSDMARMEANRRELQLQQQQIGLPTGASTRQANPFPGALNMPPQQQQQQQQQQPQQSYAQIHSPQQRQTSALRRGGRTTSANTRAAGVTSARASYAEGATPWAQYNPKAPSFDHASPHRHREVGLSPGQVGLSGDARYTDDEPYSAAYGPRHEGYDTHSSFNLDGTLRTGVSQDEGESGIETQPPLPRTCAVDTLMQLPVACSRFLLTLSSADDVIAFV